MRVFREADLGRRVALRRVTDSGTADVVGELVALTPDQVTVRREDGSLTVVPTADVRAGRLVPPRPASYSEIDALERVADAAWPAPVHQRLGDWFLRAAEGFTNRANSALPLGDPGLALPAALAEVARFYADRSLPPKITIPLPLRRDVRDAVLAAGWVAQPPVLVQVAPLTLAAHDPTVGLAAAPSPEFLEIITARKAGLPPAATHVLTGPPRVCFAEARADGALVAITRGAVVGAWLHLGLVEVVPAARRQGLARRLAAAVGAWAADAGATRVVLQVEEHNTAAVTLYASLGFRTHHRYVTYHLPT